MRIHSIVSGQCPLLGLSLFVWVQGCPRRCPGCFNTAAQAQDGAAVQLTCAAVARLWRRSGGGLVLSGGEPFSQATDLARLCRLIRRMAPETPVLTYTGYYLEELLGRAESGWLELLRQTDVLVDGPYQRGVPSDIALLGSGNQRIFFLSGRVARERLAHLPRTHVQASVGAGGQVRLVGTGALDMHGLVETLRAQGLIWED